MKKTKSFVERKEKILCEHNVPKRMICNKCNNPAPETTGVIKSYNQYYWTNPNQDKSFVERIRGEINAIIGLWRPVFYKDKIGGEDLIVLETDLLLCFKHALHQQREEIIRIVKKYKCGEHKKLLKFLKNQ